MLASFFEVEVCSLAGKGEQTQPGGKKEDGGGAGGRAGGTDCTGSPVTAVLARPVLDRRRKHAAGLPRENLRSTTTQRERGNDDGTRRREEEGQRLQKASDSAFRRAQQARVSRRASVQAAGRTIGLEHAFGWMLNFGAFSASMNRATGGLRCVF
jgi:hypothetical protein